jgi:hypothetical protein
MSDEKLDHSESESLRRSLLESAVNSMSEDTKNQLLLQAVRHFKTIKTHRDNLIIRVGELDKKFGEWILKKAEEDEGD